MFVVYETPRLWNFCYSNAEGLRCIYLKHICVWQECKVSRVQTAIFFSAPLSPHLSSLLERLALDLVPLRSGEGGEYESPVGKSPIILALEGQGGS